MAHCYTYALNNPLSYIDPSGNEPRLNGWLEPESDEPPDYRYKMGGGGGYVPTWWQRVQGNSGPGFNDIFFTGTDGNLYRWDEQVFTVRPEKITEFWQSLKNPQKNYFTGSESEQFEWDNSLTASDGPGQYLDALFWKNPVNSKLAFNYNHSIGSGPYLTINPLITRFGTPGSNMKIFPGSEVLYGANGNLLGIRQNGVTVWVPDLVNDSTAYWSSWKGWIDTFFHQNQSKPNSIPGYNQPGDMGHYEKIPNANPTWETIYNVIKSIFN